MKEINTINKLNLPNHLAIILDGNGRWAKKEACLELMGINKALKI